MIVWRALLAVSFLLLGGCLVTFKDPIPAHEAAPIPLLGEWSRKNEWGELQYLQITRAGSNVYKARTYVDSLDNLESAEVIYNLDVDRILQEVEQGVLHGEVVEAAESDGVLISSPLEQVFGYLDDQANSDVFIEVARYQRAGD